MYLNVILVYLFLLNIFYNLSVVDIYFYSNDLQQDASVCSKFYESLVNYSNGFDLLLNVQF